MFDPEIAFYGRSTVQSNKTNMSVRLQHLRVTHRPLVGKSSLTSKSVNGGCPGELDDPAIVRLPPSRSSNSAMLNNKNYSSTNENDNENENDDDDSSAPDFRALLNYSLCITNETQHVRLCTAAMRNRIRESATTKAAATKTSSAAASSSSATSKGRRGSNDEAEQEQQEEELRQSLVPLPAEAFSCVPESSFVDAAPNATLELVRDPLGFVYVAVVAISEIERWQEVVL